MKVSISAAAALCFAALLATFSHGLGSAGDASLPTTPAPRRGMAVSIVTVKDSCFIDTLKLPGHIVPREIVLAKPDVEGLQIGRVLVEDGATVGAGEPIAQLVRPDWMPGTPAKATLSAPAPGILTYRQAPIGAMLSARGEPLFRIIRDGEMELLVQVPLAALGRVEPGQPARITLLDETEIAGTVRVILPDITAQTQLGHARVKLRGGTAPKVGSFATAAIDVGRSCGATIPLAAVLYGSEGAIVQVVRNDRVETRRVKTGLFGGHEVEIRDGLSIGEIVVARAGAFLREGDPVRPVP